MHSHLTPSVGSRVRIGALLVRLSLDERAGNLQIWDLTNEVVVAYSKLGLAHVEVLR